MSPLQLAQVLGISLIAAEKLLQIAYTVKKDYKGGSGKRKRRKVINNSSTEKTYSNC